MFGRRRRSNTRREAAIPVRTTVCGRANYDYLVPCSTALLPYSTLWIHARVIDFYNGPAEL